MAGFCSNCGAQLPDNANHCPGCGKPAGQSAERGTAAAPAQVAVAGGLTDNLAGMLAYVTIIPAIIFLVIEPYNRNRFIRFHAFQSIFFFVAVMIAGVALTFLAAIPILGWVVAPLMFVLGPLLCLCGLVLWVLMLIKAYNGQMWKLPIVGDFAEKQAEAM
jgi:uncharacterized membrane protein